MTQDYGVAAMVLGKRGVCYTPVGKVVHGRKHRQIIDGAAFIKESKALKRQALSKRTGKTDRRR